jgi:NAD(P)-dependent dehydrogenase (short-subunit alcohol dehydrogenase family)
MRVALVTGGAGGLGLATAKQFAKDGMTVVVADVDRAASEKAAAQLGGSGHLGLALDVRSEEQIVATFTRIETEIGPISVLAHFAGILGAGGAAVGISFVDSTVDDWDKVQAVNARGTFLCVREMARRCRVKPVEHGRIIAISSLAGESGGLQAGAAYSASKAAVLGLVRTAARDLGSLGVTVNAIAPGPIDTPMLAQSSTPSKDGAKYSRLDSVPLGRVGEPEEIAAAASFLASIAGGYVTGATIDVNGGLLMR